MSSTILRRAFQFYEPLTFQGFKFMLRVETNRLGGFGRTVQHSAMGRVKAKLRTLDNAVMLEQFVGEMSDYILAPDQRWWA